MYGKGQITHTTYNLFLSVFILLSFESILIDINQIQQLNIILIFC